MSEQTRLGNGYQPKHSCKPPGPPPSGGSSAKSKTDPSVVDVEATLRRLAALAINQLIGPTVFDNPVTGTQLRDAAVAAGLFTFDKRPHAPKCPANHFHETRLPTGPCKCAAQAIVEFNTPS